MQFSTVLICDNQYDEFLFYNCTINSAHLKIMVPGLRGQVGGPCKSEDITGWELKYRYSHHDYKLVTRPSSLIAGILIHRKKNSYIEKLHGIWNDLPNSCVAEGNIESNQSAYKYSTSYVTLGERLAFQQGNK